MAVSWLILAAVWFLISVFGWTYLTRSEIMKKHEGKTWTKWDPLFILVIVMAVYSVTEQTNLVNWELMWTWVSNQPAWIWFIGG